MQLKVCMVGHALTTSLADVPDGGGGIAAHSFSIRFRGFCPMKCLFISARMFSVTAHTGAAREILVCVRLDERTRKGKLPCSYATATVPAASMKASKQEGGNAARHKKKKQSSTYLRETLMTYCKRLRATCHLFYRSKNAA